MASLRTGLSTGGIGNGTLNGVGNCASLRNSAPVLRLMMYPDGARVGVERIAASVDNAISKLGAMVNDVDAAREKLLG